MRWNALKTEPAPPPKNEKSAALPRKPTKYTKTLGVVKGQGP